MPNLTSAQSENLIQRLSNAVLPRLTIPFAIWGALLAHDEWRQQLYRQQPDRLTNLGQWFQRSVATGWQSLEALLGSDWQFVLTLRATTEEATITQGKRITLETEPPQTFLLLLSLTTEADERVAIMVQLHLEPDQAMPADLTLALLANTGETLQSVQSRSQDNYIQLRRFRCPIGTTFSLSIQLAEFSVTENFVL
jgi:hypothetical protein